MTRSSTIEHPSGLDIILPLTGLLVCAVPVVCFGIYFKLEAEGFGVGGTPPCLDSWSVVRAAREF